MDASYFSNLTNRNVIYEKSDNQFVTSLRNIRFDLMDQMNESGLFIYFMFIIKIFFLKTILIKF